VGLKRKKTRKRGTQLLPHPTIKDWGFEKLIQKIERLLLELEKRVNGEIEIKPKFKLLPKNPKRITTIDINQKNKIQKQNEKWIEYLKSLKD
jgi:hypothetical protein